MEDSIEFSLSEEQDDEAMTYTIMVKEDNNKMATKMLMMDKDLEPIFEHSLVACKRCGCLQEVPENATDNASDENGLTSQISGTDDGPPPAISITNQKVTSLSGKGEEHGNLATEEANSTKSPLYEEEHVEPIDVDRVKIVPKWQVKEDEMRQGIGSGRISGGLDPRCKERRKATLLTKEGPLEVTIVPSKAEKCPGTEDKYRCPVPGCLFQEKRSSRVFISKHFREKHRDYRSWRDVFLNKDAPPFVIKDDASTIGQIGLIDTEAQTMERANEQEQGDDQRRKSDVPMVSSSVSSPNSIFGPLRGHQQNKSDRTAERPVSDIIHPSIAMDIVTPPSSSSGIESDIESSPQQIPPDQGQGQSQQLIPVSPGQSLLRNQAEAPKPKFKLIQLVVPSTIMDEGIGNGAQQECYQLVPVQQPPPPSVPFQHHQVTIPLSSSQPNQIPYVQEFISLAPQTHLPQNNILSFQGAVFVPICPML